jgi:hypothetical protein
VKFRARYYHRVSTYLHRPQDGHEVDVKGEKRDGRLHIYKCVTSIVNARQLGTLQQNDQDGPGRQDLYMTLLARTGQGSKRL